MPGMDGWDVALRRDGTLVRDHMGNGVPMLRGRYLRRGSSTPSLLEQCSPFQMAIALPRDDVLCFLHDILIVVCFLQLSLCGSNHGIASSERSVRRESSQGQLDFSMAGMS